MVQVAEKDSGTARPEPPADADWASFEKQQSSSGFTKDRIALVLIVLGTGWTTAGMTMLFGIPAGLAVLGGILLLVGILLALSEA